MTERIIVDTQARALNFAEISYPCTIGKGGACAASDKREGDGCTPRGLWPIRGVLLRPGRVRPQTALALPWRWTRPDDGWSDDVKDPAYNRPILLPRGFSHELLQRDDAAYDIIIVLGHNDAPPVPGMGSAIFWHLQVTGEDGQPKPTEGCIAISRQDMDDILPRLKPGITMEIA